MKKLLFIDCCIRKDGVSRTKALCRAYLDGYLASHPDTEVEEIRIADEGLTWIDAETADRRAALNQKRDYSSDMFRWARQYQEADRILIGAPYWDLSIPSLLKIYIENICVEGLTFVCTDTGFEGRARFDRMIFITTSGGYIAPGADGGTDYLRNIASFTGSGCFEVYKAEGLDLQGNDPDQILRQAMVEVRKAASEAS